MRMNDDGPIIVLAVVLAVAILYLGIVWR